MVQVERLAIEVAGGLPDLEELLDLRVMDVEIDGRGPAAEGPLADRQGEQIHDPDERNDAAGLALAFHGLADRAHAAPVGADAAAIGGQPDVLVPGADDAFQAVRHGIEVAGDRQPPVSTAVRQHRRRWHEPELGDVVVDALCVVGVVGVGGGHAGEHVLVGLAGQQIASLERRLAEVGQQRIARAVDLDLAHQVQSGALRRPRRLEFGLASLRCGRHRLAVRSNHG